MPRFKSSSILGGALGLFFFLINSTAFGAVDPRVATLLAGDVSRIYINGEKLWSASYLRTLYADPATAPTWTQTRLAALRAEIARAYDDGLDPADFLAVPLAQADKLPAAERELLATEALARLAFTLRFGKANPQRLDRNWNYSRRFSVSDPAAWLRAAIAGDALADALDALRPLGPYYRALSAALVDYRARATRGGFGPALPGGPTLKPGTHDPRVSILRKRLLASVDLRADGVMEVGDLYDDTLVAAVRGFQRRHGLVVDGAVGRATTAALNVAVEARIAQLRVNLERVRWVFRDLEETFVAVNIAAFYAAYFERGEIRWRARAIVGRPYRQTPIFKDRISYLELNPTWTVPPTILRRDILPQLRRDPAYLKRKNLQVVDPNGGPVNAAGIDWKSVSAGNFRYFLRQKPGPDNALGRIKFMFPNAHAVYLHDTPQRALFDRAERVFSSGCIRIENPLALAELLLHDAERWSQQGLEAAIASGATTRVALPRKVTIMLLYLTAFPDERGEIQFRQDIYARDAPVRAALNAPLSWTPPHSASAPPP